jgi:hypothetical protein
MMKRHQQSVVVAIVFLLALGLLTVAAAEAEAIQIDIYSGYTNCADNTDCGGGAPYSGLKGSFTSSDVLFATNTGYAWHPFGLNSFGALIIGYLNVASSGSFSFTLNSDDGSMLYIDGALVVNNGFDNGHPPRTVSNSASLLSGLHPFRIEFFEDFGGQSGVDLYLPSGVTYVPEPLTLLLLGFGLIGLAGVRRFGQ